MQLEIENLSKTYPGGVRALDSVSLDIPRGMFGLLGPNGAGTHDLEFIVDELPYEAGVDPRNLLIDRVPDDNLKKVTSKT